MRLIQKALVRLRKATIKIYRSFKGYRWEDKKNMVFKQLKKGGKFYRVMFSAAATKRKRSRLEDNYLFSN